MSNRRLFLALMVGAVLSLFAAVPSIQAKPHDMELEVRLIWGTNDEASPDPNHKPIDAELAKKLSKAPSKWKNYFEVCSKAVSLTEGATNKVSMSKQCDLEMKNLADGRLEVKLV